VRDETDGQADETIFLVRRSHPETNQCSHHPDQSAGAIMFAIILNAIYRQLIRAALPGISRQGGKL
jgi:hypothetical protein